MGADLCSNNLFDFDEDFPNEDKKIIKKQDKFRRDEIPETIHENSIDSNPDLNEERYNNQKYYKNYEDINNLRSSIFDNEENDHIKKYEQEINTEEHNYLFNNDYNINKKENVNQKSINNYTFKNSSSGIDYTPKTNSQKKLDFNKSNEFILNNKRSFKNMEESKSQKNSNNTDGFISFGNNSKRTVDTKRQNEKNDINKNKKNTKSSIVKIIEQVSMKKMKMMKKIII